MKLNNIDLISGINGVKLFLLTFSIYLILRSDFYIGKLQERILKWLNNIYHGYILI